MPSELMKKIVDYKQMTYALTSVCIECHRTPRERSFDKTLKDRISMQNGRAKAEGLRGDLTFFQWKEKLDQSEGRCLYCTRHVETIDLVIEHLIPITRGGHTTVENVVPACKWCNFEKGNRTS